MPSSTENTLHARGRAVKKRVFCFKLKNAAKSIDFDLIYRVYSLEDSSSCGNQQS